MVTISEVEQYLALGHEVRSFEVKGPGELKDKAFCARVARATMAMGNIRDGGLVCIGIDDDRMAQMLPGLDARQLEQWSDFDDVSDALARYSDPPVTFSLQPFKLSNGSRVVVIVVEEFESVPHICRRQYPDALQDGMTYVRPRRKPESVPVPSSTDMRELLDLATDKGVREFIRRAGAAGIGIGAIPSIDDVELVQFADERSNAWETTSAVTARILASGYIDVAVRPGPYLGERVPSQKLESLLGENAVRLRGWPVPYVDQRIPLLRHGTWIGQDIEPQTVPHCEAWRLFTSGQFLHRRILTTDLVSSAELAPDLPNAMGSVAVWDVLLYLVEVAEFGARLAASTACETIAIDVSLNGIAGRQLVSGDFQRDLHGRYITDAERLESTVVFGVSTLIEAPRIAGVTVSQSLLHQFGLDVADQVLLEWQDKVFGGR